MSPENQKKLAENTKYCNSLSDDQLFEMFKSGKCPREPEHLIGVPLGTFNCEVCGIMVVAGLPHPTIKWVGDYKTGWADYVEEGDNTVELTIEEMRLE